MKHRILQTIVVLLAITGSATAQKLTIAPIEVNAGEQAELVVSASNMNKITALQFNLALPQGITLNESSIAKGEAASGHTLSVETLDNGDHLIVLYHTDLGLVGNGTLLRLPITVGQQAGVFSGDLNTVRMSTALAVSKTSADAAFNVTVKAPVQPVTITANNLTMTYGDNVPTLTYKSEGAELNGTPSLTTSATKTSPVGTYPITVTKGTVTNEQVTYVAGTLTITKAPLTVGVKNETITEGDAIPSFTLTYSGFRNSDTEVTALTTKPVAKTTATQSSPAGTYPITVSGGEAQNYALTYEQGTLTIEVDENVADPVDITNRFSYCWNSAESVTAGSDGTLIFNAVEWGGLACWLDGADWSAYSKIVFEFAEPTTVTTQILAQTANGDLYSQEQPGANKIELSFDGKDVTNVTQIALQTNSPATIKISRIYLLPKVNTGIASPKADIRADGNPATYNLAGQKVNAQYKGIVIQNGKKIIK